MVGKGCLIALLMASVLGSVQPHVSSDEQEKAGAPVAPASQSLIKVTITTGGGLHGPVKSQFKVGEDVPVVVSLTNTGDKPAKYCLSTSVFQNRPQLERDGKLIPHLTHLIRQVDKEDAIQNCERSAARQFYELQPKEKRVVDWIAISQSGIAWYDALPAGHYELVLKRRVECCQGQLLDSNKVAFDVVP
jgi:hypothetical protein